MKTFRLTIFGALASIITIAACQRTVQKELSEPQHEPASSQTTISSRLTTSGACDPSAYVVTLESRTPVGGNWEWVWSVENSNPGNGNNGTVQDLSHWGMQFGSCFNWSSVVSAAFSANGVNWTAFTPSYQVDPSQSCLVTPVLKFDFGTLGAAKSYYKLVMNQNYPASNEAAAYYKSGNITACCTFYFNGVGCLSDGDIR